MLHMIRSTWFVLLIAGLLVACAAPAPTESPTSAPVPTTRPEPTQPVPTSTPGITSEQVTISVDNESFEATVTGNGEIAILIADSGTGVISEWAPLVDVLKTNRNLRIVTFAYRDLTSTGVQDVTAVHDYLRAEGIEKTICIGAGIGSRLCTNLQQEPDMIGMVLIGADGLAIDADFPKLFLTADADPLGMAGSTERVYNQSAEPKSFKTYAAGVHGPALFANADVGPQVLADISDFIDEIVNRQ
jgi:hypothetical protein